MKTFLLSLLFALPALAEFTVPATPNPVNDYANVLNASGKERIAREIVALKKSTGAQAGVLIVDSLNGESLEEASMKVATTWKLGTAGKDDGLLVFLAIKDRKVRIEVGRGLEGIITDADARKATSLMKSSLRAQRYDDAILTAVRSISASVQAHKEELSNPVPTPPLTGSKTKTVFQSIIITLVLLSFGVIIFAIFSTRARRKKEEEEARLRAQKLSEEEKYMDTKLAALLASRQIKEEKKQSKKKEESSRRSSDTYVVPVIIPSSYSSSDSGSSYSSSSSDSSSSWSGGGGDFSGGGSSDSW